MSEANELRQFPAYTRFGEETYRGVLYFPKRATQGQYQNYRKMVEALLDVIELATVFESPKQDEQPKEQPDHA